MAVKRNLKAWLSLKPHAFFGFVAACGSGEIVLANVKDKDLTLIPY
jgi:hypothetical protein